MSDETKTKDVLKTEVSLNVEGVDSNPHAHRRLEKIHQHLAETLESPDTLQACMGPVCCDLLEMAQNLKSALDESLCSDQSSRDKIEKLAPAIRMYLKVVQQAEKFAKLDMRIKELKHLDSQVTQNIE